MIAGGRHAAASVYRGFGDARSAVTQRWSLRAFWCDRLGRTPADDIVLAEQPGTMAVAHPMHGHRRLWTVLRRQQMKSAQTSISGKDGSVA